MQSGHTAYILQFLAIHTVSVGTFEGTLNPMYHHYYYYYYKCSNPTCFGKVDEVVSEESLELCVVGGERLLQDGPQASKEGQGVQHVEGEAAGVGHQVLARGVHGAGRRVRHHEAVHGTLQGRWDNTTQGTRHNTRQPQGV